MKCRKSQYMDRGFPRDFFLMDELTEELRRLSEEDRNDFVTALNVVIARTDQLKGR